MGTVDQIEIRYLNGWNIGKLKRIHQSIWVRSELWKRDEHEQK